MAALPWWSGWQPAHFESLCMNATCTPPVLSSLATSVWQPTQRSFMVCALQGAVWQAPQCFESWAWLVTPPSAAPWADAFNGPALNRPKPPNAIQAATPSTTAQATTKPVGEKMLDRTRAIPRPQRCRVA